MAYPRLKELKKLCQFSRGKGKEALDVRLIYRNISVIITSILIRTSITANHVTTSMFILGLIAAVLFYQDHLLAGAFLMLFTIILDYCDGEVARYHNASSKGGSFMDLVYHITSIPLMLIFVGYSIDMLYVGVSCGVLYLFGMSTRLSYFYTLYRAKKPETLFLDRDRGFKSIVRRLVFYEYYTAIIYLLIITYLLNLLEYGLMFILLYLFLRWIVLVVILYIETDQIKTTKLRGKK